MPKSSNLPETGFIRLKDIIGPQGPIPISRSSWFAGIKDGRFPKPVSLGPRTSAYKVEDIRALLSQFGDQSTEGGKS